ncbi:MAG: cyclic 2,3-diphosphoglycerate synthase [Acidilobaceae archaeon]
MRKSPVRVLVLGAGGRDFHNFNLVFRDNPMFRVVAFALTQIPGVALEAYPSRLAGSLYPEGVRIVPAEKLEEVIREESVDLVVLAFSDLTYRNLGSIVSRVLATGASFAILGPRETMLESEKPVIAVTATRTGAGKSSVARRVASILTKKGYRVAPVRHPMVYNDFKEVFSVSSLEELDEMNLTLEEREEFEHYVRMGLKVYAGVDYARVVEEAERDADVILWDGGNNDWPLVKPDYSIAVADAMRPGQEVESYPGEVNIRLADAVIVNKVDRAKPENVKKVVENVRRVNPRARISLAVSRVYVDKPELVAGKRVVVVEDAPTVTHGEAPYGAGYVAAVEHGAEVVDPRPYAVGWIERVYRDYPHIGPVVPTLGYTEEQLRDLERTLERIPAETVVLGAPIDLARVIRLDKPIARVSYEVEIVEGPSLEELVEEFLERVARKKREYRSSEARAL